MLRPALAACLTVAALPALAQTDAAPTSQENVVQPAPPEAAALDAKAAQEQEALAEQQLAVDAVRLGLLKARTRLAQGQPEAAAAIARATLQASADLPVSPELMELIAALEQVEKDAAQAGGGSVQPPSYPAQPYSSQNAWTQDYERYMYVADLRRGYKADEADALTNVDATRLLPDQQMTYPANWQEISRMREKYKDGIMYAGPEFTGPDGQTMQTVMYDIGELISGIPDFIDAPTLDLERSLQFAADRHALRQRSQIFGGYAHDLAEGVPLLGFFGGVDETHAPMPSDEYRQEELMRLIQRVIEAK